MKTEVFDASSFKMDVKDKNPHVPDIDQSHIYEKLQEKQLRNRHDDKSRTVQKTLLGTVLILIIIIVGNYQYMPNF